MRRLEEVRGVCHVCSGLSVKKYVRTSFLFTPVSDEPVHEVFPAAMKYAMRAHIQKLCGESYCVDTLLMYLNGVGKSDGTQLLWDSNGDGIVSRG